MVKKSGRKIIEITEKNTSSKNIKNLWNFDIREFLQNLQNFCTVVQNRIYLIFEISSKI